MLLRFCDPIFTARESALQFNTIVSSQGAFMQTRNLFVLILVLALTASMALPAFAQDGAATYKTKCASCHGPEGQGKIGPALKGTTLTAEQIVDLITKGNDAKKVPHKKALSTVSADDAKAVAAFVKALK
jgi:mono/diheme cytochrome c family protein